MTLIKAPVQKQGADESLTPQDIQDILTVLDLLQVVKGLAGGTGITIDDSDPENPIINANGVSIAWGDISGTLSDQTDLQSILDDKVDKVAGKELSDNNFTDAEKSNLANQSGTNTGDQDISGISTNANDISDLQNDKVDKVPGKELSDNNFTDAEKTKLGNQSGVNTGDQDISGITTNANDIANLQTNKVDKVAGKELSDNNFTDAEKTKLGNQSGVNTGDQDISGITTNANDISTLDGEVVKVTGAQSVAGVKTFTNSPIVPTPTTDFQVATKKYVDDNAGGSTTPVTFGEKAFWGYDVAGGINIDAGWTDISLDTEGYKDNEFIHASDSPVIELDEDGVYQITYYVTTDCVLGQDRSESEARIVIDTGSGYTEEPGTRSVMYNRIFLQGAANGSVTIVKSLSATDKIKIQARRRSGPDSIETYPDGCGIVIRKLLHDETIQVGGGGPDTHLEDLSFSGTFSVDVTTFASYRLNLTANSIISTFIGNNLQNNTSKVINLIITSDTQTETLFLPSGSNQYGTYDPAKRNMITISITKNATGIIALDIFINQPD